MSNAFTRLKKLLPDPPLLIGTVSSTSNGVALVTLIGGGVVTARGSAAVGTRVFVKNGVIESTAPNLTLVQIEV